MTGTRRHAEFSATDLVILAPRFWSHVDRSAGETGCWNWTASLATNGYGQWFPRPREHVPAHRFAKMLDVLRTLDFGEVVMHKHGRRCPKNCVNPGHLVIGTYALNNAHTAADGDAFIGAANGMARLSEQDVVAVRALVASAPDCHGRADVIRREAERLSVHHGHLRACVTGRFWSHVPGAVKFRRALPSKHAENKRIVAEFFERRATLDLFADVAGLGGGK